MAEILEANVEITPPISDIIGPINPKSPPDFSLPSTLVGCLSPALN